jgi:single-stranded-DNA-specific exonuclease
MEGFVHPPIPLDAVVDCGEVTFDLLERFSALAPFGMGNQKPLLGVVGGVVKDISIFKGLHVKVFVEKDRRITEAMSFNAIDTALGDTLVASKGRRMDFIGTLTESRNRAGSGASDYIKLTDVMVQP